jgi:Predicted Rossmann fold nucleotide-binding protein involved in DNA uptake
MIVAVIGSRNSRSATLELILQHLPARCSAMVSGGAIGVDTLAREAAAARGLPFTEFLPDYESLGARAPLARNIKMIEHADMVLAFWDYKSRGTAFTIKECLARNIPVQIIRI